MYCLVAKNFWLALSAYHCTRTLQPTKDVFRVHFHDLKKDPDRFVCTRVERLNVEKILAVKDGTLFNCIEKA